MAMNKKTITRDQTITIRCTLEEKRKITEKARKENKTNSTFMIDAAYAGLERNRSKDRKRVSILVDLQQNINQMNYEIQNSKDYYTKEEVVELVGRIDKEMLKLWCV